MVRIPLTLTLLTTLLPFSLCSPASLTERQNTDCYCGVLTGTSCGSRTSSGVSLSGDCSANTLYNCTAQFGNAEVVQPCLICSDSGQDGYDSCVADLPSLPGVGLDSSTLTGIL